MQITQAHIERIDQLQDGIAAIRAADPDLVLAFGAPAYFAPGGIAPALVEATPRAVRLGCSSAGEILGENVYDGSCVLTAARFERTGLREATTELASMLDSRAAGRRLAEQLAGDGLAAVVVLGLGVAINGSALIAGIGEVLGPDVPVSGGLAGDGGAFAQTWVLGGRESGDRRLSAIGLYGPHVQITHGCFGGWLPFGPTRRVTRCDGNVLLELDGEPALEIYRRYLGDYARDLPMSGLLFPFAISDAAGTLQGPIRTILGIDDAAGGVILAGEVEAGGYLKLMHAGTDALASGAGVAARSVAGARRDHGRSLALLFSCVGRRLVMGDRVEDELDAVRDALGPDTAMTGFYSYGEISPAQGSPGCQFHNQTMAITHISES